MKTEFIRSEWTEDLLNEGLEEIKASKYKYYPTEPITITELLIDMPDIYNGHVRIKLSDDIIEYICEETFTRDSGPGSDVTVTINFKRVAGNEFLGDWCGSGSWVVDLMNFYEKNKPLN